MTFADFITTDADRCIRVDLFAWDGSQEQQFFISSHNYEYYVDRLMEPLRIRRVAGGVFDQRAEATVSAILIDNKDRAFDDWIDYGWHGRSVVIKYGSPDWAINDSRWSTRFTGIAEKIEADDDMLTLHCRDLSDRLDRPVVSFPLSIHPAAFLSPKPFTIGAPKNVTPQHDGLVNQTVDGNFCVNAWNALITATVASLVSEVYENGPPSAKSNNLEPELVGGGHSHFNFNVTDPTGQVTCDPLGATDSPRAPGGNRLNKAGESMIHLFSYEIGSECGFAQGGSNSTIILDSKASSIDDHYNGAGADPGDPGYIRLASRSNPTDPRSRNVADYDGATRTVTLGGGTLPWSVQEGDYYEIYSPANIRQGALIASEVDTAAWNQLDVDAPYNLGIYGQGTTYLELLDSLMPWGFAYWWTSDGKITCDLLRDPSSDPAVMVIDEYETRGLIRIIQEDAPPKRVRVGYDRNWTPGRPPADETTEITRAAFMLREYLWEPVEDLNILTKYPEAETRDFESFILSRADANTEAERILALLGNNGAGRKRIALEGLSALFTIDLLDVVTLKDSAYGHANGKDYRVMLLDEELFTATVDAELWG